MNKGEIIIYSTPDGQTALDVHLEEDTVWLTQAQMVELFGSSKANISEHITSVYKTQELESKSTVRKIRTVQKEGSRNVSRNIEFYNLDMIIAIGYRVNSKRGTQFRIWANSILKDYLVKGYAINQKAKLEQLEDLKKTIKLLSSVVENHNLSPDETSGLLQCISCKRNSCTLQAVEQMLGIGRLEFRLRLRQDSSDRVGTLSSRKKRNSAIARTGEVGTRYLSVSGSDHDRTILTELELCHPTAINFESR